MGDDLQETRPTRASVRNASVARGKRVMMRRAGEVRFRARSHRVGGSGGRWL